MLELVVVELILGALGVAIFTLGFLIGSKRSD